jgi:uncharacterized protein YbaP (TraB family)
MMNIRNRARTRAIGFLFLPLVFAAVERLTAQEKNFLWKIRSEKNTVYVLGSVHFLKKDNYPLKPGIEEAYANTKKLVLEVDLQNAAPEKSQGLILQRGLYDDGRTLQQAVSREIFSLVEKRAQEFGLPAAALDRFKPWSAAMTLLSLKLNKLGFDQKYGLDWHFFERAKRDRKDVVGLETFEYQIGIFDQMSSSDQEQMLGRSLKDLDVVEKEVDRLIHAWLTGNVKTMEALLLESFREYPKMHQKLLIDRNRQWLRHIEDYLSQSEPYLLVVGAAHLVGKGGLIELLKERGYSAQQM